MVKLLVFVACLTVALASPPKFGTFKKPIPNVRIVEGTVAEIEDYPYQVSILWSGSHICGGTIISDTYVVTAAHCTYGTHYFELSIRAGSSDLHKGGQIINVNKIHQHPQYIHTSTLIRDYDISILELTDKIIFGDQSQAIGIIEANVEVPAGTEGTITGWGLNDKFDVELPSQLHVATVPIVDSDICNQGYIAYGGINQRMICAGQRFKGSCHGDSGGPLVTNGVLTGIDSFVCKCGVPGYPAVYSNVAALRDFITEITGL